MDAQLQAEIRRIRWFHSMPLGGTVTPGVVDTAKSLAQYQIPADLSGKTFLDIGAWDGFFSFEAERRGAKRVLATDWFVWQGRTWGSKQGFDTARRILNSKVEDLAIDLFDLSPEKIGTWDVVLLAGVLYHTKDPFRALEHAASVTRELLIVETVVDCKFTRRPAIAFYPNDELDGDPTNWCAPNPAALLGMLAACGFDDIRVVYRSSVLGQFRWALRWFLRRGTSPFRTLQQGRVVVHARKRAAR
jgi:tRNA (mo5U34)-methyltransferase